ncbi:hypothetical protein JXL21_05880 [Candidatus Bathyarchaeota archaeon]|nr:hypothetical protein [Candidatus Bathyarchaeota archaeon]
MLRYPEIKIEPIAYFILILGALGDWVSTRLGLSMGLVEGNNVAASLMGSGSWIQVDLLLVAICIAVPFLLNRVVKSKVAHYFFGFPLVAGVAKILVSIWNLNLILG